MNQETVKVSIASSTINTYSQIVRACLAGMNACAKVQARDEIERFSELKTWAEKQHEDLLLKSCPESSPAWG